MFNEYPYTDLHNLNLDWFLDQFKELKKHLTDLKKMIMSVSNTANSNAFHGGSVTPVYVGDYLAETTKLPSCCVRIGDYFYAIDAPKRAEAITNRSNAGIIRKFSVENNVEIIADAKTADVGHANSIAYNGETVYIAPIWDSTSGEEVAVKYLYTFDSDMNPIGTISLPTVAMGVSYDWKERNLYYYDYDHNVYKRTGESWEFYTVIDFDNVVENELYNRSYNQDFAVYDNRFFISSPYGNIIYGTLEKTNSYVTGAFIVTATESMLRYHLGELEGFEFTQDGHLYALNYVQISSKIYDAFIVELYVGTCTPHSTNISGKIFAVTDGTLQLNENTQTKFALNTYEIRSLLQLECRIIQSNSTRVSISGNVEEPYNIRLNVNTNIIINGNYMLQSLTIYGGNCNIQVESGKLILTSSTSCIYLHRAGKLTFSGENVPIISLPNKSNGNNFINIEYDFTESNFRQVPVCLEGYTLCISSTPIKMGTYMGSTRVMGKPDIVSLEYVTNSYVSETEFQRCRCSQPSRYLAVLRFNLQVPTTTNISSTQIGKLTGITLEHGCYINIASQSNKSTMVISIEQTGEIFIYSASEVGGHYRAEIPLLLL